MDVQELVLQNSWWKEEKEIENEREIAQWNNSAIRWEPRQLNKFTLDEDVIYTLRGPRQVGKTTLVKLLIRGLLQKGLDKRRIFYWTCDLVENPTKLVDVVQSYLRYARQFSEDRLYVFLDEISSVPDWQKGIKHLSDLGLLRNATLVLTGSHTIDISRTSEKLPGRRGEVEDVLDKILPPMKFSEYVETRNEEIHNLLTGLGLRLIENRRRVFLELNAGKISEEVQELALYSDDLALMLNEYLITGGIARAIDAYIKQGLIPAYVYRTYVDAFLGDVAQWGRSKLNLKLVAEQLLRRIASRTSWTSISKDLDISPHTVIEYVQLLTETFVIQVLYGIDPSRQKALRRKNKKLHFADPFIFHALNAWVNAADGYERTLQVLREKEIRGKLVESVVGSHLIRFLFNWYDSPFFDYQEKLFHWYDGDREVDFALNLDGQLAALEVKYKSDVNRREVGGIYKFRRLAGSSGGIMISERTLRADGIAIVPAHIFLMLC